MGNCCKKKEKLAEDEPKTKCDVSCWQFFVCALSFIFHMFDVGTDINLAVQYYFDDRSYCCGFTITIVIIACIVGTLFSIRMYQMDEDNDSVGKKCVQRKLMVLFMFFVPLVPVLRYIDITRFAWKCRQAKKRRNVPEQVRNYELMVREDSDLGVLRILEGFLEAAPQQILQITILLVDYNSGSANSGLNLSQTISIVFSFLSMAWVVVTYHRSVRLVQSNKNNLSWISTGVQFMWHILVIISRIMAIAMIFSLYPTYTAIGLFLHSVLITLWLSYNEKWNFCNFNKFYEAFVYITFGLVYIFTFFCMSDGKTRNKYIPYYALCLLQNLIIAAIWYLTASMEMGGKMDLNLMLVLSTFVPFICGLAFMGVYYKYFHPNVLQNDASIDNQMETLQLNSKEIA